MTPETINVTKRTTMKTLAVAIALLALAGCAQLTPSPAAGGASAVTDSGNPDWLRDPARGQYPYSPKGW